MFDNWKLKNRLLVMYAAPVLLFTGFSAIAFFSTGKTIQTFQEVNQWQGIILQTDDILLRVSLMARQVRGYLLVGNAENALASFDRERNNFQESANRAEKLIQDQDAQQQERFRAMVRLAAEFDDLAKRTFRLKDEGKQQEAVDSYLRESKRIVGEFDQLNQEFSQKELGILTKNIETTRSSLNLVRVASLLIPLIALALAVVGAYLISQVTQQIGSRVTVVEEIAEKISNGDLTSQVEVSDAQDEIGKLQAAFRSMIDSLNTLIRQVQKTGIQITTSATQIAASGKQLEATLTEQAASTNQVAATAKEIAATSSQLVKTMEEVENTSQATAQAASDSQQDISHMEKTMKTLAEATGTISSKLGVINEKANNINSIVTTITKVADQTNLLSLNAAIEAEKAGEYGTGFAVVAREIRRLADQTAVATLDIENMVKEMQSAVSVGVMEMDKVTQEVNQGVKDIHYISGRLAEVIEEVKSLTPEFEGVNQGMEEQAGGAQQISEAMQQLSEASLQTADSLREINGAISQLNQASSILRQEISRFKVAA